MNELGAKLRDERVRQGWGSGEFAASAMLEVETLKNIEEGTHYPYAIELDAVLAVLRRPLSWVDGAELPLVMSRYAQVGTKNPSPIEYTLETVVRDIHSLMEREIVSGVARPRLDVPRTHNEAAHLANLIRKRAGIGLREPLMQLPQLCESLGLWEFAVEVDGSPGQTPGLMMEVTGPGVDNSLGIAVIDSSKFSFHQRFVLAHELCHWLIGDDYEGGPGSPEELDTDKGRDEPLEIEEACSSFAAHLLLPDQAMSGFRTTKHKLGEVEAALEIAKTYGMGWRSTIGLLKSAGQLSGKDASRLLAKKSADEEIIRARIALEPNRVSSEFLRQLRVAEDAGVLSSLEAQSYGYGAQLADADR